MFSNLESQELLNRRESFRVCSYDVDASARRRLFELVRDFATHLFHDRNAWRHGIVYKHGDCKIAVGEGFCIWERCMRMSRLTVSAGSLASTRIARRLAFNKK